MTVFDPPRKNRSRTNLYQNIEITTKNIKIDSTKGPYLYFFLNNPFSCHTSLCEMQKLFDESHDWKEGKTRGLSLQINTIQR